MRQHHYHYHYWIVVKDLESGGRTNIIYGDPNEEKARMKALEMLQGLDFSLHRLPTSDRNSASAILRGKKLARGQGLHASTQRQGRDRSVKRMLRKRQERRGY